MECVIDRKELQKALAIVNKAISRRSTLPILSGVRLVANGHIELAATDLELMISTTVPGEIVSEGTVIAPNRDFLAMVKAQPLPRVTVRSDHSDIRINGGGVRGMAADDYPTLPSVAGQTFSIGAQTLRQAFSRVLVAASADESRQILTGLYWDPSGGEIAATDSYRLAVAKVPAAASEAKVVIPARAAARVVATIGKKDDGVVIVNLSDSHVSFVIGTVTIAVLLIEGDYVNYQQLIPSNSPNVARCSTAQFLVGLTQVAPMAQNGMPVKLSFQGSELEISAHTPNIGEASAEVPCNYQGDSMVIAFAPSFLEDGLKATGGQSVEFLLSDGLKPALIRNAEPDGFLYLLMPVRLS